MTQHNRLLWDQALRHARVLHDGPLNAFCPFPDDLAETPVQARDIQAAAGFERAAELALQHPLSAAFHALKPYAHWRDTYQGTSIDADFLNRFACYALIGDRGGYVSAQMKSFMVYMPAGLRYPWHHHPAEEVYVVLAGSAEFHRAGETSAILHSGDVCEHRSNQPHAMVTHEQAVIAYVVWRGDLDTLPVWSDELNDRA